MKFAILFEVNGRQRVDTTGFQTIEDARNLIRARHGGYSPRQIDQATEQREANPHYVEIWSNPNKVHQNIVIVAVDSDGKLVDQNQVKQTTPDADA